MSILDLDCDIIDVSVIKFVKIYYGNYHRVDDEYLQIYPYLINKNDNINVSINDYDPWTILYVHLDTDGNGVLISDQEIIDDKIGYKLLKCLYHNSWGEMGEDDYEVRLKDIFLYINMYKEGKLSINFNWELQTWID